MKHLLLVFCFLFIAGSTVNSQTLKPGFGGTGFQTVQSDSWGNDVLISNRAPLGQMSGVGRPNGEVFVAVPDTTPGFSLRIYKSTDFGSTFSLFPTGIQPGGFIIPKTKMVRSGLDSIYCTFLLDDTLYTWNVESNNFGVFTTVPVLDYDIAASSTGGLYLFTDNRLSNALNRYGSSNGGATWGTTGLVSSNAARPQVRFSESGDTLLLNYYGPVLADTSTSIIRSARYRETALGTMASVAFINAVTSTAHKDQFQSASYNGSAWIFWTEENTVIKGINSVNGGLSFLPEFTVAGAPGHINYWFDALIYKFGGGGVDFIHYDDSASVFNLNYTSNSIGTPTVFGPPTVINQHPTGLTAATTIPRLVEFYDAGGDVGVIYIGMDGANTRLYYDRLSSVTNIQNGNGLANSYELKQNYPNPFNPTTKINFSIPKEGFTTLKVFDIVGREVATLVASKLQSGNYDVEFIGSNLASGVYFYQLVSNDFISVKKMILTK
jgi:hypothetical protein